MQRGVRDRVRHEPISQFAPKDSFLDTALDRGNIEIAEQTESNPGQFDMGHLVSVVHLHEFPYVLQLDSEEGGSRTAPTPPVHVFHPGTVPIGVLVSVGHLAGQGRW